MEHQSPVDRDSRKLLTHEQTIEFIDKAQSGDQQAKEILVSRNIALVKSVLKRFLDRGYEYDDLLQIGTIGLIKAIQNYDKTFNVRFSTYAVPMIMGEIKRFIRDDGIIKISRSLKELAMKAMYAKEQLKNTLGREPTIHEIADELDSTPEEVIHALESGRPVSSIYDVVYEDDSNPILMLDKISSKDDELSRVVDSVTIDEVLSNLEEREKTIIIMRYFQDKTQGDIAKVLGISQVQVSRLEKKILLKMREML
ncbi:MAG: RNA polymerase sporulation sigma factor SigF [Clostridiales bacterium]|nr:RNA polymerase sporulation sigma factor SigF [Clostridiales bacterium]